MFTASAGSRLDLTGQRALLVPGFAGRLPSRIHGERCRPSGKASSGSRHLLPSNQRDSHRQRRRAGADSLARRHEISSLRREEHRRLRCPRQATVAYRHWMAVKIDNGLDQIRLPADQEAVIIQRGCLQDRQVKLLRSRLAPRTLSGRAGHATLKPSTFKRATLFTALNNSVQGNGAPNPRMPTAGRTSPPWVGGSVVQNIGMGSI